MSYFCFIQARYSSKRLRGKVFKKFGKYTLLEVLLKRLKKSKKITKIILLTSNSKDDKKIINFCKQNKVEYFTGSLKNVFYRFKKAIKIFKPDRVIRISGDSPLIDWRLIDKMISISKKKNSFDIISNVKERTFPKGQSVEILNSNIFNINNNMLSSEEKEHVTKFFYNNNYKIYNFNLKKKYNEYNLSVDYYKDYLLISKLIKKKGIYAEWKSYIKSV